MTMSSPTAQSSGWITSTRVIEVAPASAVVLSCDQVVFRSMPCISRTPPLTPMTLFPKMGRFASNFVLLAMTTMLIISVVKSSLALSLGLVGALSIVLAAAYVASRPGLSTTERVVPAALLAAALVLFFAFRNRRTSAVAAAAGSGAGSGAGAP